jgi:repressor LexA
MATKLTRRQKEILQFIADCVKHQGAPPTVREIASWCGMRSPASAQRHLRALEAKGFLRRRPGAARGIELIQDRVKRLFWRQEGIPLLGRVAAGEPLWAEENIESVLQLEGLFPTDQRCFALRVQGDSMSGAGILDGDLLIVRPQPWADVGEIVVALLDSEEGVVKRLARATDREVVLESANPAYPPIRTREVQIVGVVLGLIRPSRALRWRSF